MKVSRLCGIGAAEIYYRAIASVGAWTSIGATVDDVVFRINQTTFNPSEDFNGILEPIREMDYISKAGAEAEFSMPEFAGSKLALAVLGFLPLAQWIPGGRFPTASKDGIIDTTILLSCRSVKASASARRSTRNR